MDNVERRNGSTFHGDGVADAAESGIRLHETAVTYAGGEVAALGQPAELSPIDGRIKLRLLVDRTSIETFANDGEASMTSCFLPKKRITGLELYTKGGNVTIRTLRVIKRRASWSVQ
jgi:sucrose-6-phosphate hydrolase SacC (GH32 family)